MGSRPFSFVLPLVFAFRDCIPPASNRIHKNTHLLKQIQIRKMHITVILCVLKTAWALNTTHENLEHMTPTKQKSRPLTKI